MYTQKKKKIKYINVDFIFFPIWTLVPTRTPF